MSFSTDTKRELCKAQLKYDDLICAEAYGLLLFCKKFSPGEMYFRTESSDAANRFAEIISERTGSVVELQTSLTARKKESTMYKVVIPNENDCRRILAYFGHDNGEVSLRINRANIENEHCAAAFLRGAFLTCGNITSPDSEYHLEFNVPYKNLSEDLCKLIKETTAFISTEIISPKIMTRRGAYVVYLKDSEDISDLLTLMGAGNASMAVMQAKIMKSYKNAENRKINSEIANTDKAISAAAKQTQAIKALDESGKLTTLSEELREVAELRMRYPVASLKELCGLSNLNLSKSGLNHRLNKLIELADSEK